MAVNGGGGVDHTHTHTQHNNAIDCLARQLKPSFVQDDVRATSDTTIRKISQCRGPKSDKRWSTVNLVPDGKHKMMAHSRNEAQAKQPYKWLAMIFALNLISLISLMLRLIMAQCMCILCCTLQIETIKLY